METTEYETNLEARIAFKRLTGIEIRLTPYQKLDSITVDDDQILVSLTVFQVQERPTQHILTGKGTRLIGFKPNQAGVWAQVGKGITAWEDDFEPVGFNLFQAGKSPAEWFAAREYERICHRPGIPSFPLDNVARTEADFASPRMVRHWR